MKCFVIYLIVVGLLLLYLVEAQSVERCSVASDCSLGGQCCVDGECVHSFVPCCHSDIDCDWKNGESCNINTGQCESHPIECRTDSDCGDESVCGLAGCSDDGTCWYALILCVYPPWTAGHEDCYDLLVCDIETGDSCVAVPNDSCECVNDEHCLNSVEGAMSCECLTGSNECSCIGFPEVPCSTDDDCEWSDCELSECADDGYCDFSSLPRCSASPIVEDNPSCFDFDMCNADTGETCIWERNENCECLTNPGPDSLSFECLVDATRSGSVVTNCVCMADDSSRGCACLGSPVSSCRNDADCGSLSNCGLSECEGGFCIGRPIPLDVDACTRMPAHVAARRECYDFNICSSDSELCAWTRNGYCREECFVDSECAVAGEHCDPGTNRCASETETTDCSAIGSTSCTFDSECDDGLICTGDRCSSDGCCEHFPVKCLCSEELGGCVECLTDFHCPAGYSCVNGNCGESCAINDHCNDGSTEGGGGGGVSRLRECCDGVCQLEGECDECRRHEDCFDHSTHSWCTQPICLFNPLDRANTCTVILTCPLGEYCNEELRRCDECLSDGECDDGVFCNGEESCWRGECVSALWPRCRRDQICLEDRGECISRFSSISVLDSILECKTDYDCSANGFCERGHCHECLQDKHCELKYSSKNNFLPISKQGAHIEWYCWNGDCYAHNNKK